MGRTQKTAAALAAVAVLAGCGPDTSTVTPVRSEGTGVIDVEALPLGPPPRLTHLAGGELHWRGRTVATDLPADVHYPALLGVAGGRLVLTGYQQGGDQPATRFWSIGPSGHARRLGRGYDAQQYPPALVASTAHLFVHNADRTTPWTISELDARTGRELATYDAQRPPRGLAAADQALVNAWLTGVQLADDTSDATHDGSRAVRAGSRVAGDGQVTTRIDVLRTDDRTRLARFAFDTTDQGRSVDGVRFEGHDQVLVLLTLRSTRRVDDQLVVRCAVTTGSCERATPSDGAAALGIDRPLPAR